MITKLLDNFFGEYFKRVDTYKDSQGKGIFERYLEIFEGEIAGEIIPAMDNILNVHEAMTTPKRFLLVISEKFGNPPNLLAATTNAQELFNRGILAHYVNLRKLKGTPLGIKMIFAYLGYVVEVTEELEEEFTYDSVNVGGFPHTYDNGHNYDSEIPDFGTYDVVILHAHPNALPVDQDLLGKIYPIIRWMEPIDMRLNKITYASDVFYMEDDSGYIATEANKYIAREQ